MRSMKWPAVAMLALAALALPWQAAAQDGGTARITATAVNADRNGDDAIRIDVSETGGSNVGAFEVLLSYSDAALELREEQTSFERGPFLGSSGREVFCPEPTITTGHVRYACVTLGAEPLAGSEGDGLLVSIYFFKKKDGGERRIALDSASLSSPMGQSLPSEAVTGEVALPDDGGSNTLWYIIGGVGVAAVVVAVSGAAVAMRRRR